MERPDLQRTRAIYLRKMKKMRQEGRRIFFLDETWMDSHSTPSKQWLPPDGEQARKLPTNRGHRFVLL